MAPPGRPRLVTTERIVAAGMRITLPRLSIRGVARALGVSEMSIYRVVGDLEGLRSLVAEGIVARQEFPEPTAETPEEALVELARGLRDFVIANPGIGHHLAHLSAPRHDLTIQLAERQQAAFAARFGCSPVQASLMVSTVAEHAVALAEINPSPHPGRPDPANLPDQAPTVRAGAEFIASLSPEQRFEWSIRATARGVMTLLADQNASPGGSGPS